MSHHPHLQAPVILLVDDSLDNLTITTQVIQDAIPRALISTIDRPQEVMGFLAKTEVDLAIVDVQMPTINGLDLCKQIKAKQDIHTPVLLITSHGADASLKARGLAAGADDFISRPLDNVELIARIKVALRIKQAEDQRKLATRQTVDQFNAVFNSSSDCILIWDKEYNYIYANTAAITHVGANPDNVIGKNIRDGLGHTPDFMHIWMERIDTVFATGERLRVQDTTHLKGQLIHTDSTVSPILNSDGSVQSVCVISRDISQLKKQEMEISIREQISTAFHLHQKEETLYDAVLDIARKAVDSPLGVFGYLRHADLLVCPSMTSSVWAQCAMADKSISFPRERWGGQWGKALRTGKTQWANDSFHVPKGHVTIHCSMSTAIIYGGRPIGLLQVANKEGGYTERDVQQLESIANQCAPILKARLDKQKAQRLQQQALDDYTDLYNNVPAMLVSVDAETGQITQCNQALLDTLGYTRHEVIGKQTDAFYPEDVRRQTDEIVRQTLKDKGQFTNKEILIQRKDGSTLPVTIDVSAIRDDHGNSIGSSTVIHDISDRKELERQMILTTKMTTIASLAAGVAHEINTPLSGILQASQLITMGLDPQDEYNRTTAEECGLDLEALQRYFKQKELDYFLKGIEQSANKAATIVTDLLHFSRPQDTTYEKTDINGLLDQSITLACTDYTLKKKYNIANVTFHRQYDQNLAPVHCIPMEIEQVFINLIKNSCQAMARNHGPETPEITISTRKRGEWVLIKIQDNGIGLPEEEVDRIFEPFFTTKDIGEGTGLGLSVCYSIITDKHGGKITAATQPTGGTLFKIQLPYDNQECQP